MGFGRDKVSGSYKVVRMFFYPSHCEILDVDIGEWRRLSPPPYEVHVGRRSACVNGSIYWFDIVFGYKILALDLHTEEFHDVSIPADMEWRLDTHIVNFEDRLALVTAQVKDDEIYRRLEIWTMDAEEGRWSKTHSLSLSYVASHAFFFKWFTPIKVSTQGDLLFNEDDPGRLFKHHALTNIVVWNGTAISPYLENLVRFKTARQLDLRQVAYVHRTRCCLKDEIASAHGISSLQPSERAYISLCYNQIKMLLAILFIHLLSSVCTGHKLSLPMLVWLASLEFWDIIKFIVMILVFKLVMMSSLVLIVGVSASAFIPILVLRGHESLSLITDSMRVRGSFFLRYVTENANVIFPNSL